MKITIAALLFAKRNMNIKHKEKTPTMGEYIS
jgi:hypothetical protein